MIEFNENTRFLEAALRELMENPDRPRKIALVYINSEGVNISYKSCTYADLQQMGQELINEGTLRLVALNKEKMQQIRDEAEAEENSDDAIN